MLFDLFLGGCCSVVPLLRLRVCVCLCDSALEMAPVEKYTLCSQVAAMKPSSAPTSKKPVEMAGKSLGFFFLYACLGDAGADYFLNIFQTI